MNAIKFIKISELTAQMPQPMWDRLMTLDREMKEEGGEIWAGFMGETLNTDAAIIVQFFPLNDTMLLGELTIQRDGHVTDRSGIGEDFLKGAPFRSNGGPESGPLGEDHES